MTATFESDHVCVVLDSESGPITRPNDFINNLVYSTRPVVTKVGDTLYVEFKSGGEKLQIELFMYNMIFNTE